MSLGLERVKRITSHVGYARFLAECERDPQDPEICKCLGVIPRQADIPSPYHYSPTWYVREWVSPRGTIRYPVVIVETAHKRYDVFHVPRAMVQPLEVSE